MTSVVPLFPYPIMICSRNYEFTSDEEKYITQLEMSENAGNFMSSNEKILESAELADLKAFIESQILVFKKSLLKMKDENEIYITQSWANNSKSEQFHPRHRHLSVMSQ